MYTGRFYSLREVWSWTWREMMGFLMLSLIPMILHEWASLDNLSLPWLPIALLGTAVTFLISFKNNASYNRLWEARQAWGGIVNASRGWAAAVMSQVQSPQTLTQDPSPLSPLRARLIHRHLAWLTALRYQLRQPRPWEDKASTRHLDAHLGVRVSEWETPLEEALSRDLADDERAAALAAPNPAAALLMTQSLALDALQRASLLTDYRQVAMQQTLRDLLDFQGKCERIKNFPYPRQYATLSRYFVRLFIVLVPLGMLEEFEAFGPGMVWLTVPFSVLIAWIFHTMEKIGSATENPFEGSANDVPITTLCLSIERDLLHTLGEPLRTEQTNTQTPKVTL